jgi:hypothetical protein
MKKAKMYRHGDILLIKVSKIPDFVKPYNFLREKEDKVILVGETTGHAHRLKGNAKILEIAQNIADDVFKRIAVNGVDTRETGIIGYAVVDGDTELVHEEHRTITLPKGIYEIRRQKEFDESQVRFVRD